MKRQRGRGRVALAAVAAACAVATLPGQSWAAGEPSPYVFDSEAKPVQGTPVNINGPELTAGSVYRDAIEPGEKRYYRIDLDDKSNAYVSAVAVPKLGTTVGYPDKLEVGIEDNSGSECSGGEAEFGSASYARPVADYASRRIEKDDSTCQQAGAYYVVLERSGDDKSTPEPWDVELRFAVEPGLKTAGPTEAPEDWPSASPPAPAGGSQKRHGGTSFHDSTGLGQGEWQDSIKPGETLFYRVPVDWGQQLFVGADLANSPNAEGAKSVSNAVVLALHNPARGFVADESSMYYDGKQKTVSLDPLPPVVYENRYDSDNSTSAMRFAGWYYLSVTLNPEIAEEYGKSAVPLTLRVNVKGEPQAAPAYAGPAGDFTVTEDDREAAESGEKAEAAATSDTMMVVAVGGIGTGTILVLGLGVWTLLARRGTPQNAEPASFSVPGQAGPQGPSGQDAAQVYGQGYGQGYGYGQHRPPQGQ
ncbi:hypothetical protein [Streptomyces peucetius]|uniref:Aromatic ring-opening dioxygenase LigA n=1 Tax=Streptomyces peucetius TaxID=1950 RepID=A0ABY6I8I5_STRPE|nr:hypothetical protein [Streptomyces peucetius]UYQ63296.1 hypothetical protein OGH68_18690 [Streptomyces peucetius]